MKAINLITKKQKYFLQAQSENKYFCFKIKNIFYKTLLFMLLFFVTCYPSFSDSETILIIKSQELEIYNEIVDGFNNSFRNKKNYLIQILTGDGSEEKLNNIISSIKHTHPALIITIGIEATYKAQREIEDIPIIFSGVYDSSRYFEKMDHITGIELLSNPANEIKYMRLINPKLKKIGFLFTEKYGETIVRKFEKTAKNEKLNVIKSKLNIKEDNDFVSLQILKKQFANIEKDIEALYIPPDPAIINEENTEFIIRRCKELKIPLFVYSENIVKAGALFSLSPDYNAIGSQISILAKKILTQKIPVKSLAIEYPIGYLFVINFSTAKILNLQIEHLKNVSDKIYY